MASELMAPSLFIMESFFIMASDFIMSGCALAIFAQALFFIILSLDMALQVFIVFMSAADIFIGWAAIAPSLFIIEPDWDEMPEGVDADTWWPDENDVEERPTGMLVCVMVGDDSEHIVDPDDCTPIDDDDYCGSCGQLGCGWGH